MGRRRGLWNERWSTIHYETHGCFQHGSMASFSVAWGSNESDCPPSFEFIFHEHACLLLSILSSLGDNALLSNIANEAGLQQQHQPYATANFISIQRRAGSLTTTTIKNDKVAWCPTHLCPCRSIYIATPFLACSCRMCCFSQNTVGCKARDGLFHCRFKSTPAKLSITVFWRE